MLTRARPKGFTFQLKALQDLVEAKVSCNPSVMIAFSPRRSIQSLIQRLRHINPSLAEDIEIEELILYSHIVSRIQRHGLKYYTAYTPYRTPAK